MNMRQDDDAVASCCTCTWPEAIGQTDPRPVVLHTTVHNAHVGNTIGRYNWATKQLGAVNSLCMHMAPSYCLRPAMVDALDIIAYDCYVGVQMLWYGLGISASIKLVKRCQTYSELLALTGMCSDSEHAYGVCCAYQVCAGPVILATQIRRCRLCV